MVACQPSSTPAVGTLLPDLGISYSWYICDLAADVNLESSLPELEVSHCIHGSGYEGRNASSS